MQSILLSFSGVISWKALCRIQSVVQGFCAILTPVAGVFVVIQVRGPSEVQEAKVGHLQRPAAVDDAVGALKVAMRVQLRVVDESHPLRPSKTGKRLYSVTTHRDLCLSAADESTFAVFILGKGAKLNLNYVGGVFHWVWSWWLCTERGSHSLHWAKFKASV